MGLSERVSAWYREYEFVTAVYLLEPWEKRIVNSVMAGLAVCTVYAAYSYLPHYARLYFCASQQPVILSQDLFLLLVHFLANYRSMIAFVSA